MNRKHLSVKDYLVFTAVILGVILLDQLTKRWAVVFLAPYDTVPLWQGVLHLTYVQNPGAAFGMFSDKPWLFNTASIILILALLPYVYLGLYENRLGAVASAMVLGGGIGNMIDRLSNAYVVDFIDFRLIHFAVFNGADSFICVGAGLLVLSLILAIIEEQKAKKK